MKIKFQYIFLALFAGFLATSCKEETVELYNSSDGVYFNYGTKEGLRATVNFADSILTAPTEISVPLKLKLMGRASDKQRTVVLKSRAVQGVAEAVVTCPEIVFEPNEFLKDVMVKVARPSMLDSTFQAEVYISDVEGNNQIGPGLKNFTSFTIYAKEAYSKPRQWDGMASSYLGEWSMEKQILLVRITKQNNFYTTNDYSKFVQWNLQAIDSLRTQQKKSPQTPITIDIPFTNDNSYSKPWYWGNLQETYLGTYNSGSFVGLCNGLDVTTANEYTTLNGNEAAMQNLNKQAVGQMLLKYNTYYQDGWRQGSSYKDFFYVPMLQNVTYELIEPQAWKDEQGGKELIEKYYGTYSLEKYRFMVKVWLQHKGSDFVLNQLFPVMNEWGNVHWDDSLGGEDAIKACNKLFREKVAQGTYPFTFPEVQ